MPSVPTKRGVEQAPAPAHTALHCAGAGESWTGQDEEAAEKELAALEEQLGEVERLEMPRVPEKVGAGGGGGRQQQQQCALAAASGGFRLRAFGSGSAASAGAAVAHHA